MIYGTKGVVSVIVYILIAILESILILEFSKFISNIKIIHACFEGIVWIGENSLYFLCSQGLLINMARLISSNIFPGLSGWMEMFTALFGGSLAVYIHHTMKRKNERKC